MEGTRINKFISEHGYCSRREADRLIKAGKVFINDRPAQLGDRVSDSDRIRVLGRDKKVEPPKVYILLNKPVGMPSTAERGSQNHAVAFVHHEERLSPVGRLDADTEGLLLLTNDTVLANRLVHPRFEHEKEFVVEVDHDMSRGDIKQLQNGVPLEDGMTLPAQVRQMSPRTFAIILPEARNNQIRRMCQALGYEVVNLKRTRLLTLKLVGNYPSGHFRNLTEKEVRDLKKAVGMEVKPVKARSKKRRNR